MYSYRRVREGLFDEVPSKQRLEECGCANQTRCAPGKTSFSAKALRSMRLACLRKSVAGID